MRRFYESEENEIDFHQAAAEALPMCSPKAQDEIGDVAQNYFDESEYDSEEELSNLIYNYIDNMADSGEFTEETKQDLIDAGYIESDEELNESVLNESVGEKSFDEVEEGDIGKDYAGNEVIILAKGPASNFSDADGFEEFVDLSDYDPDDTDFNNQIDAEWPECVLVQFVEDGSEVVYSYGSDGVLVPQDNRVRQISFDFVDNGVNEQDLISRIKDAVEVAGIEIVGGPQFGDTSWSKEEYGLNEEIIGRGKYGIEVKDPRDLWVPASENYPRNGEPAEFKKEDDAKNSDLYKRLVDRYGKARVRTYKQDKPKN